MAKPDIEADSGESDDSSGSESLLAYDNDDCEIDLGMWLDPRNVDYPVEPEEDTHNTGNNRELISEAEPIKALYPRKMHGVVHVGKKLTIKEQCGQGVQQYLVVNMFRNNHALVTPGRDFVSLEKEWHAFPLYRKMY